jgi:potassium-transporting ATPase potassium-binding subunit
VTLVDTTIQLSVVIIGAIGMSVPFGLYIARMISFELRPLESPLAKVERGFFKLIGIDADKQMTWINSIGIERSQIQGRIDTKNLH